MYVYIFEGQISTLLTLPMYISIKKSIYRYYRTVPNKLSQCVSLKYKSYLLFCSNKIFQ